MKFLNWLFGKSDSNTASRHSDYEEEPVKQYTPVPKWTHAGKSGKVIYCPHCSTPVRVMNFSWSALVCKKCKMETEKYHWLLPVEDN